MGCRVLVGTMILLFLSGCASSSGFNRGALREELADKTVVNDQEIQKALDAKPQLPRPFKIGIFLKDPDAAKWNADQWNWTEEDKNKMLTFVRELKTGNQVSDVIMINPVTIAGTDLKSLRLAAAEHGVDALLEVTGVKAVDRFTNGWGWTYIALIPAIFVPATEVDVLFLSRAAMWDVRNQYLYLTAEAESLEKRTSSAAFTDERGQTEKAKDDSLDKLRDQIGKMMQGLATKTGS